MGKTGYSKLAQRTVEPPITWLMGMTLDRPQLISLAAGFTDGESLPMRETRVLMDELLGKRRSARKALQYGSTQGDPDLRKLTAAHLAGLDGRLGVEAMYDPKRLFITSGSQQLLYVMSEVLCDPGDIVLVEDPTYFVYLGITESHGLKCRGVRMASDGIDLSALERVLERLRVDGQLSRVKLLYLVSYYQNPTGITTTREKKLEAVRMLRRYERWAGHPIYLLEDAAYRELRFRGEDTASALTVPGAGDRVIYGGTFSKPFATGVRVGFGSMPEGLMRVVLRVKGNHDFGTANLLQQLMRASLESGLYEQHLAEIRRRYARKAEAMVGSMRAHFPGEVSWKEPMGGLYVWARLPARVRSGMTSTLFRAALKNDVMYVPGGLCYAKEARRRRPDHEMRISYGGESLVNVRRGIERLGRVLGEAL